LGNKLIIACTPVYTWYINRPTLRLGGSLEFTCIQKDRCCSKKFPGWSKKRQLRPAPAALLRVCVCDCVSVSVTRCIRRHDVTEAACMLSSSRAPEHVTVTVNSQWRLGQPASGVCVVWFCMVECWLTRQLTLSTDQRCSWHLSHHQQAMDWRLLIQLSAVYVQLGTMLHCLYLLSPHRKGALRNCNLHLSVCFFVCSSVASAKGVSRVSSPVNTPPEIYGFGGGYPTSVWRP